MQRDEIQHHLDIPFKVTLMVEGRKEINAQRTILPEANAGFLRKASKNLLEEKQRRSYSFTAFTLYHVFKLPSNFLQCRAMAS